MDNDSVKYNRIGRNYNNTRKADPYLVERMAHYLNPESGHTYLDIGCGTGNYTRALSALNGNYIGIDPSELMLEKAKSKTHVISWKIGTAENTGLENECVSGALASLTIHHWPHLQKGFSEIFRVLKPGSILVIFTSSPNQMRGYWLNHYFPGIMESSIKQMPEEKIVKEALVHAGFKVAHTEKYFVHEDLQDLFLYSGKHKPAQYFDAEIRNGISSFADLANRQEVEIGLARLKADMDEGRISEVVRSYNNDEGDYMFISALKL